MAKNSSFQLKKYIFFFFLCAGTLQNVGIHVSLQVPILYSLSNIIPLLLSGLSVLPSIYTICLCSLLDVLTTISSCQRLSSVGFSKSAFLIMAFRNVNSYFLILSILDFTPLVTHMFPLWYSEYPSMGISPSFFLSVKKQPRNSWEWYVIWTVGRSI